MYGKDFTSLPVIQVIPGVQNETCFTVNVTDNNVYTPDYYIVLSLNAFQFGFGDFVVYLATPQTLNITVDDEEGMASINLSSGCRR